MGRGTKFHELLDGKGIDGEIPYVNYEEFCDKTQDEVILDGWFTLEQLKIIVSTFEQTQKLQETINAGT